MISKPVPGDYASYYQMYMDTVPGGDILQVLEQHDYDFSDYIDEFPEEIADHSYAPGKWTAKQVMMHIIDAERIFSYRALCFARGEKLSLPGFEEDDYAAHCGAGERTLESIRQEFKAVRASTLHLFKNFTPEMWKQKGIANNNPMTVASLAYVTAGHAMHHFKVLKERYYKG